MNVDALMAFAQQSPILSLAFVGLTLALIYNEISRFFMGYKSLNPSDLTQLINQEDAQVIDVSAIADFEKGHIIGSKNIIFSQVAADNKLLDKAKEKAVVLVCRTGMQSAEAAKKLVKLGFKQLYWLDGGIGAWQNADMPLVKGKH
jgi:rhodanese-related sulfurtransferase